MRTLEEIEDELLLYTDKINELKVEYMLSVGNNVISAKEANDLVEIESKVIAFNRKNYRNNLNNEIYKSINERATQGYKTIRFYYDKTERNGNYYNSRFGDDESIKYTNIKENFNGINDKLIELGYKIEFTEETSPKNKLLTISW